MHRKCWTMSYSCFDRDQDCGFRLMLKVFRKAYDFYSVLIQANMKVLGLCQDL